MAALESLDQEFKFMRMQLGAKKERHELMIVRNIYITTLYETTLKGRGKVFGKSLN